MHISIEKLRRWLLLAFAVVAVMLVTYMVVAHIKRWRTPGESLQPLPDGIQQSTNGFTYSKSNQGRTLFTIHAARAEQLQQHGQAELYDVHITLYGRTLGREDRISGSEFHYDQDSGVATAKGEVLLDLQEPSDQKTDKDRGNDRGVIHIKTQGLVFLQKFGIAATDQPLEFAFNGITGHARGAEYDSDRSLLTLQSAVDAQMQLHKQTVFMNATHLVYDHNSGETHLSGVDAHQTNETAHADSVVVHTRDDGSVDHVDADGGVSLTSVDYGSMTAPSAKMWLDPHNKPVRAIATGGVHYTNNEQLLQRTATAADAEALFNKDSTIHLVNLNSNVTMHDRIETAVPNGKAPVLSMERDLAATHLALGFGPAANKKSPNSGKSKVVLQTVHATGNSRLITQQPVAANASAKPPVVGGIGTREIDGDTIDGILASDGGRTYFSQLDASGHTRINQKTPDGTVSTSTGVTLHAIMRPEPLTPQQIAAKAAAGKTTANKTAAKTHNASAPAPIQIVSAVQTGDVRIISTKPVVGKQPDITTGRADRAEYTGANQHLVLTGNPQVADSGTTLWADRITIDQSTGNLQADGTIKANYLQNPNSEPIHIVADRAEIQHAQQHAIFYGRAGADARLWQQANQVSAPILEILRASQTLLAHGDGKTAQPVHSVFPSQSTKSANKQATSTAPPAASGVVRVASHEMVYSDATHTAIYSGGVDVITAESHTRSKKATVWLQNNSGAQKSAAPKPNAPQSQVLGGSVQRILAEGAVTVTEPGRRATGESLLYTTADGHYLMTGTPAQPPKLVDDVKGTVSGASLLFESNDDTVIVSSAPGYSRPRLDTHAKSK